MSETWWATRGFLAPEPVVVIKESKEYVFLSDERWVKKDKKENCVKRTRLEALHWLYSAWSGRATKGVNFEHIKQGKEVVLRMIERERHASKRIV